MARLVLIDELHLLLRVPANCPDKQITAARRALRRRELQRRLRNSVENILASYPSLHPVRFTISR